MCYIVSMTDNVLKTVEETVRRHDMLKDGDRVLVAFSGGPDSMCMLDVLMELRSAFSLDICVAHFDHMLRPAAEHDIEFARNTAERMGLVFLTGSDDVRAFAKERKLSIEDAARRLRYEFLLRSALSLGAGKVAVGHNADDQAETVLMRLIRGSGPRGLAGIPPTRPLAGGEGGPKIIRPLIEVWRADIMSHLRAGGLKFCRDETNESTEFLRNKIRLELIPGLEKEYNPQIKRRLAAAASALAGENDFMETEAGLLAGEIILEKEPGRIIFDASLLAMLHPAFRNRVFSILAVSTGPDAPMLEALHYAEADALVRASRGRLDLPGGFRLEISEGVGLISDVEKKIAMSKKSFEIPLDGKTHVDELNLRVSTRVLGEIKSPGRLIGMCGPNRQYFDLDSVRFPIEVRLRRPGDSFRPLGTKGSKKLKDYFMDKKVPRFLRDHVPILTSNGRIMWIMGRAIDERYRLRAGSGSALRVDYER